MLRITLTIVLLALGTASAAGERPRSISVDGRGFVNLRPDMARLGLSVEQRDASLSAAQQAVAGVTSDVLELLGRLGIEERHVNSTGANVQPNYRWDRDREEQQLIGYIVRRRIDVEVHDLEVLGRLIDGAVRAGVNQVMPPQLDSTRRSDAYREALALAVVDARKNAEAVAGGLGVGVGAVMHVGAGGFIPPPIPVARAGVAQLAMAESDPGGGGYNPGEMRLEAAVSVEFAISD